MQKSGAKLQAVTSVLAALLGEFGRAGERPFNGWQVAREPGEERGGRCRAGELRDDEGRRVRRPDAGESVGERTRNGHRRVGERGG